jgi:hypothetical protein
MTSYMPQSLPDEQWGIVALDDGSEIAGFVHVEDHGHAVEVDVPAAAGSPPNVAVVAPQQVRDAKRCSVAEVLNFVQSHRWPVAAVPRGFGSGTAHEGAD